MNTLAVKGEPPLRLLDLADDFWNAWPHNSPRKFGVYNVAVRAEKIRGVAQMITPAVARIKASGKAAQFQR